MEQRSPGQLKPQYPWQAVSLTQLLVANHLPHALHSKSTGKEGSGIPEGKNGQDMEIFVVVLFCN